MIIGLSVISVVTSWLKRIWKSMWNLLMLSTDYYLNVNVDACYVNSEVLYVANMHTVFPTHFLYALSAY
jgi:hypothetical protein